MRRGLRYLPVPRRVGSRRIGLLAVGLVAALSLVWQQQATLASYTDAEVTRATFTAATLDPIAPELDATASTVTADWASSEPTRRWATPQYQLEWSTTGSGAGQVATTGTGTSFTQAVAGASPTSKPLQFTAVAAGATHACGIARGVVYCWGTSTGGGLGLGAGSDSTVARTPKAVTGGDLAGRTVTAITAGTDFTCAVAGGKAYCWGKNDSGQIGISGQPNQFTPLSVAGLTQVTSISAGTAHACAVTGGKAYCWGAGGNGQLGDGGTTSHHAPAPVAVNASSALQGRTVSSVSAGGNHSCAVADGRAFCWGANSSGQLGDGTSTQRVVPVAVDTSAHLMGRAVSAISAGGNHSCAVADGRAFCWGLGTSGQLGNGAVATSATPVPVSGLGTGTTAVASGPAANCAVNGGKVYCWGAGANYGLGNGVTGNQSSPVAVSGSLSGRSVTTVSLGSSFGCAGGNGIPVACWGLGGSYQLGDNATSANQTPADVVAGGGACPEGSVRLSDSTCSLVQDRSYYFRLRYSIGAWNAPYSAWVQTTTSTRPGLPADGTPVAGGIKLDWAEASEPGKSYVEYTVERRTTSGENARTVAVTPDTSWTDRGGFAPTKDFTKVAAGTAHSCGILDGKLYCWGLNDQGQLGNGNTTAQALPVAVIGLPSGTQVTEVTAGGKHTCALTDGQALYCWGDNTSGQLGLNSSDSRRLDAQKVADGVTAVSAGDKHTCGVTAGDVYCWGENERQQLGNGGSSTTDVRAPQKVADSERCNGIPFFGACLGNWVPVFTNGTVSDVAAGGSHSCVVSGGVGFCWGLGSSGQLGNDSSSQTSSAAKVSNGSMTNSGLSAISAGTAHTCAVKGEGAWCWGLDSSGQLGNSSTLGNTDTPVRVVTAGGNLTGVTSISAGATHTCAIAGDAAFCWGSAADGRLGNGATSGSAPLAARVAVAGALDGAEVDSLSAGGSHSCLVSGGEAYCWGSSASGKLGIGGAEDGRSYASPQATAGDVRCRSGAISLGDGTCSFAPGERYEYRVTFTLDGTTATTGPWRQATAG